MTVQLSIEWETGFNCLRQYIKIVGDSKVPHDYVTKDGFKLGAWVSTQRTMYRAGELSRQAVGLLKSIPAWKREGKPRRLPVNKWRRSFKKLRTYARREGCCSPPVNYVTPNGFRLGAWVSLQRHLFKKGHLAPERQKTLETLPGWLWKVRFASLSVPKSFYTKIWKRAFSKLKAYARQKSHYSPPVDFVTKDGFHLGAWVSKQRRLFKKGLLAHERKKLLETLPGWLWKLTSLSVKKEWQKKLSHLKAYVSRFGHGNVPKNYFTKNGFKLGVWVSTQRYWFNRGWLPKWKYDLLEQVPGWIWRARTGRRIENNKRSPK